MTELSTPAQSTVSTGRLRLRKACKLRHLGLVNHVFADGGRKEFAYPLRMVWEMVPSDKLNELFNNVLPPHFGSIQMLVTVPKKQLHHAVDRVLMRRRIREAFRLNRHILDDVTPHSGKAVLAMAFIYMTPKTKSYASVEKAMRKLLEHAATSLKEKASDDVKPATLCPEE